ncbi:MAG TPA: hypothetical protein VHU83_06220 [Bryobacteraceae bacterium]|nr:hypothetical protein [Bryobacteraceae bacterium]
MKISLVFWAAIPLIVVSETACYDPHAQDSKIVREVEAAGSGDISTYTVPGLAEWFSHRPELATKIADQCAPIARTAQANWRTSAEGTVCYVATRIAPPPPMVADQRAW